MWSFLLRNNCNRKMNIYVVVVDRIRLTTDVSNPGQRNYTVEVLNQKCPMLNIFYVKDIEYHKFITPQVFRSRSRSHTERGLYSNGQTTFKVVQLVI